MRKVPSANLKWIEKEIPLLEEEGVLDSAAAERLHCYYEEQTVPVSGTSWALTAFSILGALLIGAGIILLFAHNWDMLTRETRVILSFSPLLIGSLLSLAALLAGGKTALRESAGLFHAIAIGGSTALVGQTYHLPSDTPMFLLTWALLTLPLVFLLSSTGAFFIYLALISSWSAVAQDTYGQAAAFWVLLLPALLCLMIRVHRKPLEQSTLLSAWGWL
ncbi:MAG: DUF2157 domain-containing protein, partial [Kiritimatiellales bacterium]|nr:DUF2157 domain-containing protein [Kiritimatiellales bacterium]